MKPVKLNVDLHTHTLASDGEYSPKELIRLAFKKGINDIAITDHDTVDGIEEAVFEGEKLGINVIPGIELSLNYPGIPGSIHMLGYYINYDDERVKEYVIDLKNFRRERNLKMITKLQKLNIDIKEIDFQDIPLNKMGRAHIAKKMVEKGYVKNINLAFEKYLKKGEMGYVNKKRYPIEKGIFLIHLLGGIATLAHPYTLKLQNYQLEVFIRYLKESCELDGLEVFYPEHTQRFIRFYYKLTQEFELIPTGGSDFHGEYKPNSRLGEYMDKDLSDISDDFELVVQRIKERTRKYENKLGKN